MIGRITKPPQVIDLPWKKICVAGKKLLRCFVVWTPFIFCSDWSPLPGVGGGDTPYNGLYGEAPPERGTFFRLQVYERVGIIFLEVYERVGKSVICYCGRA